MAEVVLKVLTKFMQAIDEGKQWAIERYMDQRMWRPEDGGWRARPYGVAVDGVKSATSGGNELPPLQLIVQFVKADPSMRPGGRTGEGTNLRLARKSPHGRDVARSLLDHEHGGLYGFGTEPVKDFWRE